MPTKLRKMLGDINAPETIAMMRLIETQSQRTLTDWAERWARAQYLPIYGAHMPEDGLMADLLDTARACLNGAASLKDVKALIKVARIRCGELTDPVAVAAARAISTACAVCTTATNALGFQLYGAAAAAYEKAGLAAGAAIHDALAAQHIQLALEDLRSAAVADEPNPARIDWHC